MANWTQKKLLFTIGSSAAAISLMAVGGVFYAHSLIEEVGAQVTAKSEAMVVADKKIAQIPGLEKEVIILRENLDEYVKILPDTRELNAFLRMLSQFERQAGIAGKKLALRSKPTSGKVTAPFTPIEYTYEVPATLWQCLKFMNLVENFERFVSITEFSIVSAGDKSPETRDGHAVHDVRLTLQTYQYNGKSDGKEVVIPDYEPQREALREEIWKRMQAIRLDRYEHRGEGGRRDILVDPRSRSDALGTGTSTAEQRAFLEGVIAEVTKLREMHQRSQQKDTTLFEQYSLEKGVRDGINKLVTQMETDSGRISYAPYRVRWAKEVVEPFEALRKKVEARSDDPTPADPFLPQRDLQLLVAEMESDCKSGLLEQAKMRFDAVASRLGVGPKDPRHELAVAAKSLHVKATTALDFKRLDLKLQGVVVNHDGRSGVLVNGDVFEEGEYVSDDLLVSRVEEEQIWFVYRGLTLVRTM